MATPLHCPNCGEDLGKDTENSKRAYCGNCGTDNIRNPRGYNEDENCGCGNWKSAGAPACQDCEREVATCM